LEIGRKGRGKAEGREREGRGKGEGSERSETFAPRGQREVDVMMTLIWTLILSRYLVRRCGRWGPEVVIGSVDGNIAGL